MGIESSNEYIAPTEDSVINKLILSPENNHMNYFQLLGLIRSIGLALHLHLLFRMRNSSQFDRRRGFDSKYLYVSKTKDKRLKAA